MHQSTTFFITTIINHENRILNRTPVRTNHSTTGSVLGLLSLSTNLKTQGTTQLIKTYQRYAAPGSPVVHVFGVAAIDVATVLLGGCRTAPSWKGCDDISRDVCLAAQEPHSSDEQQTSYERHTIVRVQQENLLHVTMTAVKCLVCVCAFFIINRISMCGFVAVGNLN